MARLLAWLAARRKALAAFVLPLLALPVAEWISGEAVFDAGTVWSALAAGAVAALGVHQIPNRPEAKAPELPGHPPAPPPG